MNILKYDMQLLVRCDCKMILMFVCLLIRDVDSIRNLAEHDQEFADRSVDFLIGILWRDYLKVVGL
jgi:hypothetical protein